MSFTRVLVITLAAVSAAAIALHSIAPSHGAASDQSLAEALANDSTRQTAIASILATGDSKVPLLLSWTRRPPNHVAVCGLYDGLAEAFGQARTKAAMPFLIENISLKRSCGVDLAPWLKTPAVIEWNLPSVGALIQIGADASRALITRAQQEMSQEDRVAAIFVISQIRGVPEAEAFLQSTLRQANMESHWAEEGIKLLETSRSPGR